MEANEGGVKEHEVEDEPVYMDNAAEVFEAATMLMAVQDSVAISGEAEMGECLFVCGISLTSGQLFSELFPDCTRSCFSQVVLPHRGGDRMYEMRCLFVAVGPSARFIVLPHWDNMSQAHMLTHPVILY